MAEAGAQRVAVVGAGTMGVGIAYVFALAGFSVSLVEPSASRWDEARRALREAAEAGVKRGKLSQAQAARARRSCPPRLRAGAARGARPRHRDRARAVRAEA